MQSNYKNIDEYLSIFPADIQTILQNIRSIIRNELPKATEVISYQMPAYKVASKSYAVIYFAVFKKHIGLFFAPTEEVYKHFEKELRNYKKSKGGIQLPLDKDIDYELVRKIVRFKKLQT